MFIGWLIVIVMFGISLVVADKVIALIIELDELFDEVFDFTFIGSIK